MIPKISILFVVIILVASGCRTSTQPKGPDPIADNQLVVPANILSLRTDSLQYHRSSGWSLITIFIHNGTDTSVVFPACGSVSVRVDTLASQQWNLGRPRWEQVCLAIFAMSAVIEKDSMYTNNFLIQNTGRFRVVTVYSGIAQSGIYSDTLISNDFSVL
jgi:hypothetical protein